jgi:choline dehydrogenase-like flavoprotein
MSAAVRGRDLTKPVDIKVDACVVGLGAGGSMMLRELARAGLACAGVEEGGHHSARDFTQREDAMLPLLFQDAGGRTTRDLAIRVLQGRGVGGSTVHNTNLCKRTPPEILDIWQRKYGVEGFSAAVLAPVFARVEKELSVSLIEAGQINRNNAVLRRGTEALGWKGGVLSHNRVGCQGSGFCELGCAYDAKQNALKILVPAATAAGATVYSDVRIKRILHRDGRVTGLAGVALDAAGNETVEVRVSCKSVVLGASATGSAALALASGVPNLWDTLGTGLRLHPGAVVAGVFDEPIAGHRGIPQSYECTEHLAYEEGSDKRTWIVPAFAHPVGAASMMPGFGAAHMRLMRRYDRIAVLTAMLHDESSGTVGVTAAGRPTLDYRLNGADCMGLARGLAACARLLFAAGATEVLLPAMRPIAIKSLRELAAVDWSFVRPHALPLSAVHPMGSMRMGNDPKTSVVNCQGEHHSLRGLFVVDGSLFPTSIGAPPQISIYSFALHLAPHVITATKKV